MSVLLILLLAACQGPTVPADAPVPVDSSATTRTQVLYANLHELDDRVLFGQQDALAYGVTWIGDGSTANRSDVKAVTGSHPAVVGWDVGDIGNPGATVNLDSVPFDDMKRWIADAYERGAIVTVSWHMDNPVSGGSAWDTTEAVSKIVPGGSHHESYIKKLDRFAAFADSLEAGFWSWLGRTHEVPILFRPFHEMSGDWFWWGASEPEEYVELWRFTVEYLRDEKGLHHLLYTYSPDFFQSRQEYLAYYPGDEYVDVVGYDDYGTLTAGYDSPTRIDTVAADAPTADTVVARSDGTGKIGLDLVDPDPGYADSMAVARMVDQLHTVVGVADARDKVPAFTETGFEGIPDSRWWTDRLLPVLKADSTTRQLAYVLVWRNANERRNPGHHFAPYPGHASADDFVQFYEDEITVFEDDMPELYE